MNYEVQKVEKRNKNISTRREETVTLKVHEEEYGKQTEDDRGTKRRRNSWNFQNLFITFHAVLGVFRPSSDPPHPPHHKESLPLVT